MIKVKQTITIDPEVLKQIKIIAIHDGKKFGELIEQAVKDYIFKRQIKE